MNPIRHTRFPVFASLACLTCANAAFSADHDNLEESLPITVQDAYPIAFRALEAQIAVGYRKPDEGDDGFIIMPRLEVGPLPNLQVSVGAEFITDGDQTHSGDVIADGLYGLTQESLYLPGIALAADISFPTGEESDGLRGSALLVLTKGLVPQWQDRWHVNIGWEWASDPEPVDRDRRFVAILGYSRPVDADTVVVLDGVRRQGEQDGSPWETSAELGIRRQVTPLAVASLGGGLDFVDHSGYVGVRAVAGLQHSF